MPSYPLTGMDLVREKIPDLLRTAHHTESDSTHKLGFTQTLGDWGRFERDARRNFLSVPWNETVLDYIPDQHGYTEYHVRNEQLVCGDEHSVVARFGQNVGHVMTSVIRSCMPLNIHSSDYKAADTDSELSKVPDIVVIGRTGTIKMVGDVKTAWMHDIEKQLYESPHRFRKYLGKNYNIWLPKR
ncbi:hypothetical protein PHISCL_01961 [Aspergillus sclerotialis]|uniref:Uncharacterized protein n=1 Tax=Aspergillus sclerotialis TaxID=2070753 RepID=A0A3A2ZRB4_9EURO|nr:hypothetical protein PHISCL_01961 [Aspergillus sclerotialis]